MASSNQQQNVNMTDTASTNTAPAAAPPPKYTMNPEDRVKEVYTILTTAQMADPKAFTQLEAGALIVDMVS